MKTFLQKATLLVATCALAACSTVTVTTDYDKSAAFGKYKTYTLAPARQGQALSATGEAALRDALHTELTARGLTEVSHGKADLAIVRHVFLQDKVSVQQYTDWGYGYGGGWPSGYGYGRGYGYGSYGMWAGAPQTYVDVNHYTEGTMILDVVDTKTKKLVFRGTGQAVVGGAESNAGKIREAVKKMVASLPGGAAN
ncbi:MAG: DUF4136 domain-containing protein [Chthoniobacteraceae bacterium]